MPQAAAYPAILAAHQAKLAEWMEATGKDHEQKLAAWNEAAEKAKASGQKPPPRPRPATRRPPDPVPPDGRSTDPAVLFNGMINPLIPYGIKGVLWYQGESNSKQAKEYLTLFPAMIADWRARWKQGDYPFLYVQVAPYNGMPPEIREAQFLSLGKVKNAAMTVTTDVGDADDIHPKKKQPVGQRLALAARALAYGENIEYSGPLYESMKWKTGKSPWVSNTPAADSSPRTARSRVSPSPARTRHSFPPARKSKAKPWSSPPRASPTRKPSATVGTMCPM
jgi:sialate O-acetylesterase